MGALSRFLGRWRRPDPPRPDEGGTARLGSSDRWCAGDLAECVHTGPWFTNGVTPHDHGPRYAEIRMVRLVRISTHLLDGTRIEMLEFDAYPGRVYQADSFRKITPRADAAERADGCFVEKIHRIGERA